MVGVFCPVNGGQHKAIAQRQAVRRAGTGGKQLRAVLHHVAHLGNALWLAVGHGVRKAFFAQVGHSGIGGAKQDVADPIRQDAVDLFGHLHIEAAQTRFYVRYRNVQFDRCQCPSQGGIGIAVHQYAIGPLLQQHLFDLDQHAPGHVAMAATMNIKLVVRARNGQLVEKDIAHIGVKVLAGVHDDFLQAVGLCNRFGDNAGLDELGTGANDGEEFFIFFDSCLRMLDKGLSHF